MPETAVRSATVIGAGISGLTMAIALQRLGVATTVFERADELGRIQGGGGIHLWNNAMRALQRLDLADKVAAIGTTMERAEFLNASGRTLSVWPVGKIGRQLGVPTIGVSRTDLHPTLIAALGDVKVRTGSECVGYSQDAGGVTSRFAGGHEERSDLLIGADGIHSAVGAQEQGKSEPRYAGYTVWQATIDFHHPAVRPGIFRVYYGRGTRFAYYHVGGERLYWFGLANAPRRFTDPSGQHRHALLNHFGRWPRPIAAMLEATDEAEIQQFDMQDRPPASIWGEGRVTLAGDAAHAMTFNVGQGACQAIEDAVVLAKHLRTTPDVPAALRAYEAQRQPRTREMINLAWRIGAMARWQNPVACVARDVAMKVMFSTVGLKTHERDMRVKF